MHPFGEPVGFFAGDAEDGTSELAAHEDMDLVRRTLLGFNDGGQGFLRIYRPSPTAAFSPRDTTLANYAGAVDAVRELGFEPVERRAGGQLAVYDNNALVIDLVAPHAEPRLQVHERFERFADVIAVSLMSLGVDARVGGLAGEYCPGDHSVNGEGKIKLAGIAQRIGRRGFHIGAVLSVARSDRAKLAVASAYKVLGMSFDPSTFGAVSDLAPHASFDVMRKAVLGEITALYAASGHQAPHAPPQALSA